MCIVWNSYRAPRLHGTRSLAAVCSVAGSLTCSSWFFTCSAAAWLYSVLSPFFSVISGVTQHLNKFSYRFVMWRPHSTACDCQLNIRWATYVLWLTPTACGQFYRRWQRLVQFFRYCHRIVWHFSIYPPTTDGNIAMKILTPSCNLINVLCTGFPYNKLMNKTLFMQVLDYDRFSRDDPIGEVCIPLSDFDLVNGQTLWKNLQPCKGHAVGVASIEKPLMLLTKPSWDCAVRVLRHRILVNFRRQYS